jgi:hypothetical protein
MNEICEDFFMVANAADASHNDQEFLSLDDVCVYHCSIFSYPPLTCYMILLTFPFIFINWLRFLIFQFTAPTAEVPQGKLPQLIAPIIYQ